MPSNLRKAHDDLNRAVDCLYRSRRFEDDANCVALLLHRYHKLVGE